MPRRKESRVEARAAGRDRQWIPSLDAGFALISGLLPESERCRDRFNPTFISSGGLHEIRSQSPVQRPTSTAVGTGPDETGTALGQGAGTGLESLQILGGPLGPVLPQELEHCSGVGVEPLRGSQAPQGEHRSISPGPTLANPDILSRKAFQGRAKGYSPGPTSPGPIQQLLPVDLSPVGSGVDAFDANDDPAWGPRP